MPIFSDLPSQILCAYSGAAQPLSPNISDGLQNFAQVIKHQHFLVPGSTWRYGISPGAE
jgi:hypothetical protein